MFKGGYHLSTSVASGCRMRISGYADRSTASGRYAALLDKCALANFLVVPIGSRIEKLLAFGPICRMVCSGSHIRPRMY